MVNEPLTEGDVMPGTSPGMTSFKAWFRLLEKIQILHTPTAGDGCVFDAHE
jgi:hypothetical protein